MYATILFCSLPVLGFAGWQAPLSSAEEILAISLARDSNAAGGNAKEVSITVDTQTTPAISGRSLTSAPNSEGKLDSDARENRDLLGREVLLVELKRTKKPSADVSANQLPRIAEVFIFDYSTLKTELYRIDVARNRVVETLQIDSVHLPLNAYESETARQLLAEHTPAMQALASEFLSSFNRQLVPESDLDMKVSIWKPAQHLAKSNTVAEQCMTERCAVISVFTTRQYSFSIEPVVNLVSHTVHLGVFQ